MIGSYESISQFENAVGEKMHYSIDLLILFLFLFPLF